MSKFNKIEPSFRDFVEIESFRETMERHKNKIFYGMALTEEELKEKSTPSEQKNPYHTLGVTPEVKPTDSLSTLTHVSEEIFGSFPIHNKNGEENNMLDFTVDFHGECIHIRNREVGLDLIEQIREDSEEDIPKYLFPKQIKGLIQDHISISLTEEQAKEAKKHFKRKNHLNVTAVHNIFNDACELEYDLEKRQGRIKNVNLGFRVKEEKVYEIWKEKGFQTHLVENETTGVFGEIPYEDIK